jgi:transposase-like protein
MTRPDIPPTTIVPVCCPSCQSDRYRRTGNRFGSTKEEALACRQCGWLYSVREGQAALERKGGNNGG